MAGRTVPPSLLLSSMSWTARWTCRSCMLRSPSGAFPPSRRAMHSSSIQKTQPTLSHAARPISDPEDGDAGNTRRKRCKPRRVLLATATGAGVLAGAIAISDDARHYAEAVQRSSRVVGTLAVCINDYRRTLKYEDEQDPEHFLELLKACHKRCAERTLVTLEKNGSIFIKLGQHLSSLTYLLPNEWCGTFIPLQDKCPVSSYESVRAMILNDTGKELEEFFSEFEHAPIGAASLAQVHKAVVRETGEQVAVKVQHPVLDEWAPLDLALTRFTFATVKRWFPEYDLTWLSDEMESSLPQELDFDTEARNANRTREYFSHVADAPLIVPRVVWSRRRILVMEYVTGHRPDDLAYLDDHNIDRDEVSAALARIFNEMIFGTDAPLHCDPHGGNIAIRYNPSPRRSKRANFDIILYDHGLYRDLSIELRRSYAKLWLAVLDNNIPRMRQYAYEVAGIGDEDFELFASAITGRDYAVFQSEGGGVQKPRNVEEKRVISKALGDGLLSQICGLLGKVPRVLLLILKTNDLTRSLDENLHTRQGTARTFLILARYASRTVYEEGLERIQGSIFKPGNWISFLEAWFAYKRVELKLSLFEGWLSVRELLGMAPVAMMV